ncbi:MAG: NAD(P)H-dependent oxidoreductase [Spirochaetaceae bacterium]|nr:NAD(P)H-dependent oxidoreductase [Spirochaetaceae bacterium]
MKVMGFNGSPRKEGNTAWTMNHLAASREVSCRR